MYANSRGNFFTEEEVAALSPWEIEIYGIHVYEENQEKRLFDQMDEMTGTH